jgi:hypothetical protein
MMGTLIAAFAAPAHRPPAAVDAEGNLRVPPDYRIAYEFLGTWAVAADKDPGSKQMHDVYATPGTISAFRKTGDSPTVPYTSKRCTNPSLPR